MRFLSVLLLLPIVLLAAEIVHTVNAPDMNITGLAYSDGKLWASDGTSQYVYEIDQGTGSVVSSFLIADQTTEYNPVPGGLACGNGSVFVGMYDGSDYGYFYKYSSSGTLQKVFSAFC